MSATASMRPRAVGELLDGAIKLYVRHARVHMGLAAMVIVPLELLAAVVLVSMVTCVLQGRHPDRASGHWGFA